MKKYPGMIPHTLLALTANCVLVALFWLVPSAEAPKPAVEIAVDVVQFTEAPPPEPEEIPPEVTEVLSEVVATTTSSGGEATSVSGSLDRQLPGFTLPAKVMPSAAELRAELNDLAYEMNFYAEVSDGNVTAATSKRPPGLQTGASFDLRRDPERRGRALRQYGGDDKSEGAVDRALKWLAKEQNPDGCWSSEAGFKSGDVVALTSLAVLCFAARGENFQSEAYGKNLQTAVDWLLVNAAQPGIESAGVGFGHAMMTYALAEIYAGNGGVSLRQTLERRIAAILERQNTLGSFAGNYDNTPMALPPDPASPNPALREFLQGEPACDLSLLGWHIQALTAARNAGIMVEKITPALNRALRALTDLHQAKGGGFSQGINMQRFPAQDNLTPVGLLGVQLLNVGNGDAAKNAQKILNRQPLPRWDGGSTFPLYRWYYQTQAIFQAENGSGQRWNNWNDNLKKELLANQKRNGSWSIPAGESGFRLQDPGDMNLYATALCTLMLEVYYRYLPGYSIAESDNLKAASFNEPDLMYAGLLAPLSSGADPMAGLILGIGTIQLEPVRFGVLNGQPAAPSDASLPAEFPLYTSMSSTVSVRTTADWPQILQPNQRIAFFCDEFIPENFKGHMRFSLAVLTGSDENTDQSAVEPSKGSLEVLANGRRVYHSQLQRHRNRVEVLIPADLSQPFGNVVQFRNTGKTPLAFDAVELGAFTELGAPLFLGAADYNQLPPPLRGIFNLAVIDIRPELTAEQLKVQLLEARLAKVPVLFRLHPLRQEAWEWLVREYAAENAFWELCDPEPAVSEAQTRQLQSLNPECRFLRSHQLPDAQETLNSLEQRPQDGEYQWDDPCWGSWKAAGLERMGNEFLQYYAQLTGRQLTGWFRSGGNGVFMTDILKGGRIQDSLTGIPFPAFFALRQFGRLFEGTPRRIPVGFCPKYQETPLGTADAIGVCNAPGSATLIISKQSASAEESELTALVPWSGLTELIIEKGIIPSDSPWNGLGSPLQSSRSSVLVEGNIFRMSGSWPELTVLRLRQKNTVPVEPRHIPDTFRASPVKVDKTSCRVGKPWIPAVNTAMRLREAGGFCGMTGPQSSSQVIPATLSRTGIVPFTPEETQSVEISFPPTLSLNGVNSVYLSIGEGLAPPALLTFNVLPRTRPEAPAGTGVPLCFSFDGQTFQVQLIAGQWQSVNLPLDRHRKLPYWGSIRFLAPEVPFQNSWQTISFELNGITTTRETTP